MSVMNVLRSGLPKALEKAHLEWDVNLWDLFFPLFPVVGSAAEPRPADVRLPGSPATSCQSLQLSVSWGKTMV